MTPKEKTLWLATLPARRKQRCIGRYAGVLDHYGEYVQYTSDSNAETAKSTLRLCREDEPTICAFWTTTHDLSLNGTKRGRYSFDSATNTVTSWGNTGKRQ